MSKRKNSSGSGSAVLIILCIVLVGAAVFGGYKAAVFFSGRSSAGDTSGADSKTDVSGNTGAAASSQGSLAALNKTPVSVVYVVDSETAQIDNVFIEVLRCNDNKLDFIRLDPKISYTMSAQLYSELCVDNTELPQTVTLSELYRYYKNDKAYEAGRRIIGEMINFNAPYYTAIEDIDFEKYIRITDTDDGICGEFVLKREEALAGFGTDGSVKGVIEEGLKNAVTNNPVGERLRYLDIYEQIDSSNTTFTDAPLIEKNETVTLSTSGIGAILYGILY